MWKGYGYREGDTFSGVTIEVRVRNGGSLQKEKGAKKLLGLALRNVGGTSGAERP